VRRGRYADHHAQALRSAFSILPAVLLAVAGAGAAHAGYLQEVTRDGTVHRIVVGADSGTAIPMSMPLTHVEQPAYGPVVTRILPGTETGWNWEPALEVDPVTDEPVVVWSRREPAGFDLYLSRFDGQAWTQALAVVSDAPDDVKPQIAIGEKLIHLVWKRQAAGGPVWMRLSLDRETLAALWGPETLPVETPDPVPPSGDSCARASQPDPSDSFFAGKLDGRTSGDPDEIIVWGIRDEPMPVGYREGIVLPDSVLDVHHPTATWIEGRFTVWFVSSSRFYYTLLEDGRWTDLRYIALDSTTSEGDALGELQQMLTRADGQLTP
jgi:hypothetical protein